MLKLISHPHLDQFHFLFVSHLRRLFVNQPTGEGGIVKEEEIYRGRKSNQEPFHVPTTEWFYYSMSTDTDQSLDTHTIFWVVAVTRFWELLFVLSQLLFSCHFYCHGYKNGSHLILIPQQKPSTCFFVGECHWGVIVHLHRKSISTPLLFSSIPT